MPPSKTAVFLSAVSVTKHKNWEVCFFGGGRGGGGRFHISVLLMTCIKAATHVQDDDACKHGQYATPPFLSAC